MKEVISFIGCLLLAICVSYAVEAWFPDLHFIPQTLVVVGVSVLIITLLRIEDVYE